MSRLTLATGLLVLLAAAGCNDDDLVPAAGKLTQAKAPVADATVQVHYPDGNVAVGSTDAQGRYSLSYQGKEGTKPGQKLGVTVTKWAAAPQSAVPTGSGVPAPGDKHPTPKGMNLPPPKNVLPPQFGDPKNPQLTLDVPQGGSDSLDIELP